MKSIPGAFLVLLLGIVLPLPAEAETGREVVVQSLSGSVEYQKGGEGEWIKAAPEILLAESDVVRTADNSRCNLLFKGMSNATVELKPNSMLELATVAEEKTGDDTQLDLTLGAVLVKADKLKGESAFQVRTPNSIVGIRGTEFEVNVD